MCDTAGWLHWSLVDLCLFVTQLCGFSLSLFCSNTRSPLPGHRFFLRVKLSQPHQGTNASTQTQRRHGCTCELLHAVISPFEGNSLLCNCIA